MENVKPEQIIADLYEYRAKIGIKPLNYREMINPQELLQYNWLNVIIANLTDKYNVKYNDIEEAIFLNNKQL